jgi:hypothetical protein
MPATVLYASETRADPGSGRLACQPYCLSRARLARLAASAGGSEASQRAAVIRCPLKPADPSETSQRMGGSMISGRSIFTSRNPVTDQFSEFAYQANSGLAQSAYRGEAVISIALR